MGLLRKAAAHAAGGFGASVGPTYGAAKNKLDSARSHLAPSATRLTGAASQGWDSTMAAFAPLAEAARQGSATAAKLPHLGKDHGKNHGKNHGRDSRNKVKIKAVIGTNSGRHLPARLITLLAVGAVIGATGALVVRRRNRIRWAQYEPSSVDANSLIDSTRSGMGADIDDDRHGRVAKAATRAKETTKSAVDTVRHKIHEATAGADHKLDDLTPRAADGSDRISETRDRAGDGVGHPADKAPARLNDTSSRRGGPGSREPAPGVANRVTDTMDDLQRSAKNSRL